MTKVKKPFRRFEWIFRNMKLQLNQNFRPEKLDTPAGSKSRGGSDKGGNDKSLFHHDC